MILGIELGIPVGWDVAVPEVGEEVAIIVTGMYIDVAVSVVDGTTV